jgi:hypothetical protein
MSKVYLVKNGSATRRLKITEARALVSHIATRGLSISGSESTLKQRYSHERILVKPVDQASKGQGVWC